MLKVGVFTNDLIKKNFTAKRINHLHLQAAKIAMVWKLDSERFGRWKCLCEPYFLFGLDEWKELLRVLLYYSTVQSELNTAT